MEKAAPGSSTVFEDGQKQQCHAPKVVSDDIMVGFNSTSL